MSAASPKITEVVLQVLESHPAIQLAFLFGSTAEGRESPDSDLDLAVVASSPLTTDQRIALIEGLALASGRPVDLIDLQTAAHEIRREALTTGLRLLNRSPPLLEQQMRRLVYDEADFAPLVRGMLAERRRSFLGEPASRQPEDREHSPVRDPDP